MPKIADIEDTLNPNAWQAKDDTFAVAFFDFKHVSHVFYVDRWLTFTQDDGDNKEESVRKVADPICSAQTAAATVNANLSPAKQQRPDVINDLPDEQPFLSAKRQRRPPRSKQHSVYYKDAYGACPSTISTTVGGIERLVKSMQPDIEVVAV